MVINLWAGEAPYSHQIILKHTGRCDIYIVFCASEILTNRTGIWKMFDGGDGDIYCPCFREWLVKLSRDKATKKNIINRVFIKKKGTVLSEHIFSWSMYNSISPLCMFHIHHFSFFRTQHKSLSLKTSKMLDHLSSAQNILFISKILFSWLILW